MAPPNNPILQAALQRYTAAGREQDTLELISLFGERTCTVLLPVRLVGPEQERQTATHEDPDLGDVVHVYTMRGDLPKYDGAYTALTCTVLDLMGDLYRGRDIGVVFDAHADHAVYFRFNGPEWIVRSVSAMRKDKRKNLN